MGTGSDLQTGKRDPFGVMVAQLCTFTKKSLNCTFTTGLYFNKALKSNTDSGKFQAKSNSDL